MTHRVLLRQIRDYVRSFIRPVNLMSCPEVVETPPGSRVLVLSPHFDDDVIGCGGTLAKHVRAGHHVAVVYLTDGREGDPSNPDKDRVSALRREEARRAMSLLGITDLSFLDEPETKLRSYDRLLDRLRQIFHELQPDLLCVPWFLDNHIDHFETNRILLELSRNLESGLMVAAYEVWMPLVPNVVVDISGVVELKEKALTQYETQIRQVDYVGTTLGLNRYRSVFTLEGHGHAEAFLVASLGEYVSLMRRLKLSRRISVDHRR